MEGLIPAVNPYEQQREQAAAVAEYVTEYCGRVLDIFTSKLPETIFQQALAVEVCIQPLVLCIPCQSQATGFGLHAIVCALETLLLQV
jgi:hypothetical protein